MFSKSLISFKAPASLSEASSGCDLPQSLHEQVALSLLSEAAQELLARQLLAVHCELRQYGGNKEALN